MAKLEILTISGTVVFVRYVAFADFHWLTCSQFSDSLKYFL